MCSMDFEAEILSESALLLRFGERIEPVVNEQVQAVFRALERVQLAGVEDLVPAYASLLLRFDPDCWDAGNGSNPHRALLAAVREIVSTLDANADPAQVQQRLHVLPVRYGGEDGPDLVSVAVRLGLDVQELIARHCAPEYRVAMLGFAPGFAYLLGLDPRLQVPRREQPRVRVPAGSVALGGAQTGIYPSELPGGWQLIGRTSAALFDAENFAHPSLLLPGDRVRFERVDSAGSNDA